MAGDNDFEIIGKISIGADGALTLSQMNGDLAAMKGHTDNLSGSTSAFGQVANFVWAQLIVKGVEMAVSAVSNFVSGMITAGENAQNVQAQLNAVLKSTAGAAGVSADAINAYSSKMAGLTKFDDEAITGAQSLLLTFTSIGKQVFPDATTAILDMSQAMGQDLKSTTIQVGKALNDPITGITALKRVGVSFTEAQKDQIKVMTESGNVMGAQKLILAELTKEFGGSAEAAGKTFAGRIEILKHRFEELQVSLFNTLSSSPLVTAFFEAITKVVDKLVTFFGVLEKGGTFFDAFNMIMKPTAATKEFAKTLELLRKAFDDLNAGNVFKFTGDVFKFVGDLATQFGNWFKNIDWHKASQGIVAGIKSIDWQQAGASFKDMLTSISLQDIFKIIFTEIDWGSIFGAIGEAFGTFIIGMVLNIPWSKFTDEMKANFKKAFDAVAAVIVGAFMGARTKVDDTVKPIQATWSNVMHSIQTATKTATDELAKDWNAFYAVIAPVVNWIQTNLVPLFKALAGLYLASVRLELATLGLAWKTLQVVMAPVVSFISGQVSSVITALVVIFEVLRVSAQVIGNVIGTVLGGAFNYLLSAIKGLQAFWKLVLYPAFVEVGNWLQSYLVPVINTVVDVVTTLQSAFQGLVDFFGGAFTGTINAITSIIQGLIDLINSLINAINGIHMPGGASSRSMGLTSAVRSAMGGAGVSSGGGSYTNSSISNSTRSQHIGPVNNYIILGKQSPRDVIKSLRGNG
jgi:phage-related protein